MFIRGLTFHRHYSSGSRAQPQVSVAKVFRSEEDREHGAYHHADHLARQVARGRVADVSPVQKTIRPVKNKRQ